MDPNLNLYSAFDLDPADSSESLGLILSARDLRLENMGVSPEDPRRVQTVMAFSVLSDETKRATYDGQLRSGRTLTWGQIRDLGNFGTVPEPEPQNYAGGFHQQPQAQPQQSWDPTAPQGYTYGDPTVAPQPGAYDPLRGPVNSAMFGQSFANTPVQFGAPAPSTDRPTAGTRLLMAFIDLMIATVAGSMIAGLFGASEFLFWLFSSIIMVVYVVGFESAMGATPAKMMFGYQVRNVHTGSRLSAGAAAKRNWWKLINVIPGIGGLVTFIMAIVYGNSINDGNQLRGLHDQMVDAEVVKKRR